MKSASLEIVVNYKLRQAQLLGGDEHELYILVSRHRGYERVDGSAVFQVAAESYCKIVKRTLFVVNGQQVSERLRGMKMPAVAGIYQRHRRVHGCNYRRTLFRVTHGDYIRVAVDYLYRVGNRLAFDGGA